MLDVLKKYNEEIIKSIDNFTCTEELSSSEVSFYNDVLDLISNCDNIEEIFGQIGSNFKSFINSIDRKHPELLSFLINQIFLNKNVFVEINEVFNLFNICKKKKLNHISNKLHKICELFVADKMFMSGKTLVDPRLTKNHVRFIGSAKERWALRNEKTSTKIQVKSFVSAARKEDVDLNVFRAYHHNSNYALECLEDLKAKREILFKNNCLSMANEIDLAMEKMKSDIKAVSVGFYRITLSSIAKHLPKLDGNCDGVAKIYPIDKDFFDKKEKINTILNLCEALPAYNKKHTAFDHYGVVRHESSNVGVLVGERDTQAFFLGYYYE